MNFYFEIKADDGSGMASPDAGNAVYTFDTPEGESRPNV